MTMMTSMIKMDHLDSALRLSIPTDSLIMFLDLGLQSWVISSLHFVNWQARLEEHEGWHSCYTMCSCSLCAYIHIHLEEDSSWEFVRQFIVEWSDSFAGTTPLCSEVNHN